MKEIFPREVPIGLARKVNFNPPQGWLLIAPARQNSNKFDSALAYSQF